VSDISADPSSGPDVDPTQKKKTEKERCARETHQSYNDIPAGLVDKVNEETKDNRVQSRVKESGKNRK